VLVLDSGAVSLLAQRSQKAAATILALRNEELWPPVVPSIVLVESLTGRTQRDATTDRFLKTCDIAERVPVRMARRASELRHRARQGSAFDAVVVVTAEPGGVVLTRDLNDLRALATYADNVLIESL
jgi:hypothetical protein